MKDDRQLDEMNMRWAEAYRQARAYCAHFLGFHQSIADSRLLELAHNAMVDEADPGELLARLSHPAPAIEPVRALTVA